MRGIDKSEHESKIWLDGVQSLRGLFIILIIISHSADYLPLRSEGIWGAASVTGFFVIAGFFSGLRYKPNRIFIIKQCITSALRELKKFYPLYLICLVGAVFVRPNNLINFIRCFFLTQSYWGKADIANSFNGNTWFLSSIMLSYLLAPILNRIFKGWKIKGSLLLVCIIFAFQFLFSLYWMNNFETGYYWIYIFPGIRLLDFIQGILLSNIYSECIQKEILDLSVLEFGVGAIFLLELVIVKSFPVVFQYSIVWIPSTMIIVFLFALNKGRLSKYIVNTFLYRLGGISFELFMCHRLIMIVVAKFGTGLVHWVFAILISVSIAYFFCGIKEWRQRKYKY